MTAQSDWQANYRNDNSGEYLGFVSSEKSFADPKLESGGCNPRPPASPIARSLSPSKRLHVLRSIEELNRRERMNEAREVSSLAAFVAIGLAIAAISIWAAIASGAM